MGSFRTVLSKWYLTTWKIQLSLSFHRSIRFNRSFRIESWVWRLRTFGHVSVPQAIAEIACIPTSKEIRHHTNNTTFPVMFHDVVNFALLSDDMCMNHMIPRSQYHFSSDMIHAHTITHESKIRHVRQLIYTISIIEVPDANILISVTQCPQTTRHKPELHQLSEWTSHLTS